MDRKINVVGLIGVRRANPNGDPLADNAPRTDISGHGIISGECIKRKIRNRMLDLGAVMLNQSNDYRIDDYKSMQVRMKVLVPQDVSDTADSYRQRAVDMFSDVRLFGAVFPYTFTPMAGKGGKKPKDVQLDSVRGCVTFLDAESVDVVRLLPMQITKSYNGQETEDGSRGSDTMGMRKMVDFGLYVFKCEVNPYFAEKSGVTDDDLRLFREAFRTMFVNDASCARPAGSVWLEDAYWIEHGAGNKIGNYPPNQVYNMLKVSKKAGVRIPQSVSDYDVLMDALPGLYVDKL